MTDVLDLRPDDRRDDDSDWPDAPGWMPLTREVVERVAAIEDGALRNLWITQSYADLARRMLALLDTDQTWCTFAIWASNTAGLSIRGEELPRWVDRTLFGTVVDPEHVAERINDGLALPRRLGLARLAERCHVEQLVARAVGQVSERIAHGNLLVYAELAPIFVSVLEEVEAHGAPDLDGDSDGAGLDAWLRARGVPTDGQLVHEAFRHYVLAMGATGDERAQHVLAANIAAVLHEQERLQPDILAALDAGVADVGDDLAAFPGLPGPIRRLVVGWVERRIAAHVVRVWQDVATHLLMTLGVPGEVLHLGRDVPPLADGELFPAALRSPGLPALQELLATWDPTRGTGRGSAAKDWTVLHDRMGYIVNLFRSRQRHLPLTVAPFDATWLTAMTAGRLPDDA